MKVSFIVIAYNEERNIERTVRAITDQNNLPTYEIVVVNDGSIDKTLGVIKKLANRNPAIKIVDQQPNMGRGAARAAGISAARGDYFAFVDADILLPRDWLSRCLPFMSECDACGGTAVPDGDVAFVHRILQLVPKVASHTTTVSGSNGLFKRAVFNEVSFNRNKKNGEDVDLGYQIINAGFKMVNIQGLLVEHNETKSYFESLKWLFVSGRGASRQFYEHKELRLPDIAYFGFVGVSIVALLALILLPSMWLLLACAIIAYISASSLMHLHSKFELTKTPIKSTTALLMNDTLLLAYYLGRCMGLAAEWKMK